MSGCLAVNYSNVIRVHETCTFARPVLAGPEARRFDRKSPNYTPPLDPLHDLPPFDPSDPRLRWSPPSLENPTEITLPKNFSSNPGVQNQDYVLLPHEVARTGALQASTMRNVRYIGGHDTWQTSATRAEAFTGISGSVYREGGLIDCVGRTGDGIGCGGSGSAPFNRFPDVIIQNCKITNCFGNEAGEHADIYQSQGAINDLKIDKLTGDSNYQGFFLRPQFPIRGNIILSRVNLRYNELDPDHGYLMWFWNHAVDYASTSHSIILDEVYVEPVNSNQTLDQACWPDSSVEGVGGRLGSDEQGEFFWWPQVSRILDRFGRPGKVRLGPPPGGDFVLAEDVGLGYEAATSFQDEP